MRIVFMGNPEFAIPSVSLLHSASHDVVAVVTNRDKRQGRGRARRPTPVAAFARKHNIPLIQPESLKEVGFISRLEESKPDLFVVVGFRILPQEILEIPERGSVNLHGSLLPKYRGAAPIQWALMNGDSLTGLTTFILAPRVDTGDVVAQKEVVIFPDDDFGTLARRVSHLGASLLVWTVEKIDSDDVEPVPQDSSSATRAPKITPETCEIDWDRPARAIRNQIRALSPFPGAFTTLNGKRMKLFRATVSGRTPSICGEVIHVDRDRFTVSCSEGSLQIEEIQLEGKNRMTSKSFLSGSSLSEGDKLGT